MRKSDNFFAWMSLVLRGVLTTTLQLRQRKKWITAHLCNDVPQADKTANSRFPKRNKVFPTQTSVKWCSEATVAVSVVTIDCCFLNCVSQSKVKTWAMTITSLIFVISLFTNKWFHLCESFSTPIGTMQDLIILGNVSTLSAWVACMCWQISHRDASIRCQFPSWMVWWGYSTLPTPEPTSQRKFTFPLRISSARKSTWDRQEETNR